jgi:hypothetical protein
MKILLKLGYESHMKDYPPHYPSSSKYTNQIGKLPHNGKKKQNKQTNKTKFNLSQEFNPNKIKKLKKTI